MSLVMAGAVVQDFHVAIQIANVDSSPFEVDYQFEKWESPVKRAGTDKRTGSVSSRPKSRSNIASWHFITTNAVTLESGKLSYRIGEMMNQIDSVTPARVVNQTRDVHSPSEPALFDHPLGQKRMVKETIVENHRRFAIDQYRFGQEVPSSHKVILPNIFLTVSGNQRFLEENTPRTTFKQRPRSH
jgi:hypothetical protein